MNNLRKWNFKIVLAGDGAVGKTSIRERYMGKGFQSSYLKTIGADFATTVGPIDLIGEAAYFFTKGTER